MLILAIFYYLFTYLGYTAWQAECRVLVPWPGMELMPSTEEVQVLATGLPEKSPGHISSKCSKNGQWD